MDTNYFNLNQEDIEYVLIKTTELGPFFDDYFALILTKNEVYEVSLLGDTEFNDWLETLGEIDWATLIKSAGCAEDRTFLIYKKSGSPVLSENRIKTLENRLERLLIDNLHVSKDKARTQTKQVFGVYSDPTRHYHNLSHISHCLWEMDQIDEDDIDRTALEISIWFHDVIYKPKSKTNELDSANYLKEELENVKNASTLDLAQNIIKFSPLENCESETSKEMKYFWDIDHSILGQHQIEYLLYKQNIELEYTDIMNPVFKYFRKKLLIKLLNSGIYCSERFREIYGSRAHHNVSFELASKSYKLIPPWI